MAAVISASTMLAPVHPNSIRSRQVRLGTAGIVMFGRLGSRGAVPANQPRHA